MLSVQSFSLDAPARDSLEPVVECLAIARGARFVEMHSDEPGLIVVVVATFPEVVGWDMYEFAVYSAETVREVPYSGFLGEVLVCAAEPYWCYVCYGMKKE